MEILEQMIGIVALIFWVMSIQTKDKYDILRLQILSSIFYSIQYFMLGAISAACMGIVCAIRSIWFAKNETNKRDNSIISLLLFLIVVGILGVFTCNSIVSALPIIITFFYTYSTWQKNNRVIRVTFLIAAFGWIFYNTMVGAYVPLIGNIIEVISGIISIIRFDVKNKINDF